MVTEAITNFVNAVRYSQLLRVLLIGFLVLLLQIPIAMIEGLIRERTTTRDQAVEEVTGKWGNRQNVVGPVMVVPYVVRSVEEGESGQKKVRTSVRSASFLPETLRVDGRIDSQIRYRGIFGVPVYRMDLTVKGRFPRPDFSDWGVKAEDIQWERVELWVGISDARAIQSQTSLSWSGSPIPFQPGSGERADGRSGIHVSLKGRLGGNGYDFSFPLVLNGSVGAFFAPLGKETTVTLKSNWSSPSFQGEWLPVERTVKDDGFEARWVIPSLGRNYPQSWTSTSAAGKAMDESKFGVDLLASVDPYRMSERSVKYEHLFLLLTFLSLWLFEILAGRRLHSLQYLLVGAAMCVFYLLMLSLAEHLGFLSAYLLASLMVVGLITAYCAAILKRAGWTSVMGGLLAALYAYLYILLTNEDYALLIGSVGLFLVLAAVMYLTRRTDWTAAGMAKSKPQGHG